MVLFGGILSVKTITFLMFTVFAIAAVGYALGRITIKGVCLGTAGVFIVALLYGCFFYEPLAAQLTVGEETFVTSALKIVENMGLILFVTSVGFIAGPTFVSNFKKNFASYVVLGLVIIIIGGLSAVGCIYVGRAMGLGGSKSELTAMVVGLLSGSLTSTPAFSAAKDTVAAEFENAVSVGHGIAYIFGVIGVVLFVQIVPKLLKADMDEERKLARAVDAGKSKRLPPQNLVKLDSFSFLPFAFAAALGIILGSFKFGNFSLTTTGGCLLAALVFGHFGHIGRLDIMPTEHTLKVFRELGLMLFLIGAGIPGGAKFIEYFDIAYFVFGVVMTILPMVVGYFIAKYLLKLSLLNNLGSITGGMTSTPALGTLIHVAKTEDVANAYAATYPVALISVVLASQFIILWFS